MNEITQSFGTLYHPIKAFVVFSKQETGAQSPIYVESYDINAQGCPINGHPLSVKEGNDLAKALTVSERKYQGFLCPKGLLPKQVVYLKNGADGFAIWYTPAQKTNLIFTETLGIPNGEAPIPALVWKANKSQLQIFAFTDEIPTEDTLLCHAPFFNTYENGRVCMGNVHLNIPKDCRLENFIALWQQYFFNSYFSHLFGGHQPVKGNIVQLWKSLVNSADTFPTEALILTKHQIKSLLP